MVVVISPLTLIKHPQTDGSLPALNIFPLLLITSNLAERTVEDQQDGTSKITLDKIASDNKSGSLTHAHPLRKRQIYDARSK
jgi:hypothetical protein